MSNSIKIPRVSDRGLIASWKRISDKYSSSGMSGHVTGGVHLDSWNFIEDHPGWKQIQKINGDLIANAHMAVEGLTFSFTRGGGVSDELKSPYFDSIVFTFNNQSATPSIPDRIDIVAMLTKDLGGVSEGRGALGSKQHRDDLDTLHNSILERLEQTSTSVIEKTSEFAVKVQGDLAEGRKLNDVALQTARATLDEEHAQKLAALVIREVAFESKLSEIDNRNNTHARREIRNGMLADVKNRIETFGVSDRTQSKRTPVRIAMVALIMVLLFLFGTLVDEEVKRHAEMIKTLGPISQPISAAVSQDQTEKYWLWMRLVLTSLGLSATFLYFIRWENSWAEKHANAEFQLQQFYLDVNRASWVIETCLEWGKETENSAIPPELLASVTRNLFVDKQSEPERVIHPADELASALMGSASKLTVKAGGSELEFDKPGKIKNTVKSN
jgi:hypothetical protein